MQETLSRREGTLPKLPGTSDIESRELGEPRMPARHIPADLRDDTFLAIDVLRAIF